MASHALPSKKGKVRLHPLRNQDLRSDPNPSGPVFDLLTRIMGNNAQPMIVSYWSLNGIEQSKPLQLSLPGLQREDFAILADHVVTYV